METKEKNVNQTTENEVKAKKKIFTKKNIKKIAIIAGSTIIGGVIAFVAIAAKKDDSEEGDNSIFETTNDVDETTNEYEIEEVTEEVTEE